mgnify:CR=1 FL=1
MDPSRELRWVDGVAEAGGAFHFNHHTETTYGDSVERLDEITYDMSHNVRARKMQEMAYETGAPVHFYIDRCRLGEYRASGLVMNAGRPALVLSRVVT